MKKSHFLFLLIPFGLLGSAGCQRPTTEQTKARIYLGRPATEQEIYSTVALIDLETNEADCTGVLLEPSVVLTAAHCVVEENHAPFYAEGQLAISAGVLDTNSADPARFVPVASYIYPDEYPRYESAGATGMGRDDDIALLFLQSPISSVPVAKVLSMAEFDAVVTAGATVIITGYGNQGPQGGADFGVLYIAQSPYLERSNYELYIGDIGEPDTCPGDSGGPAYIEHEGELYLLGITSRGPDWANRDCGDGTIFTMAAAYEQWIAAQPPSSTWPGSSPKKKKGCNTAATAPPIGWSLLTAILLIALIRRRRLRTGCRVGHRLSGGEGAQYPQAAGVRSALG